MISTFDTEIYAAPDPLIRWERMTYSLRHQSLVRNPENHMQTNLGQGRTADRYFPALC